MSSLLRLTNNGISTLPAGAAADATSITVATGEGARFPTLSAGQYFMATLVQSGTALEIVKVTARSGDVLTVTRAQEGTTALTLPAGSRIEHRLTAGTLLTEFARIDADILDLQDLVGTKQDALVSGTNIKTVNGSSLLGSGNLQIDVGVTAFNTRTGAVTLTSGDVTTALGYTPYNSTNPNGYITSSALTPYLTAATAAATYLALAGGTLAGALTYSPGTANGLLFLNGSKVVSSGAGLTFDGVSLGIGTGLPLRRLHAVTSNSAGVALFESASSSAVAIGLKNTASPQFYTQLVSEGDNFYVQTNGSARFWVDGAGNAGLGVLPNTWSQLKAMQIGMGAAFSGHGFYPDAYMNSNAYYDGATWRYIVSSQAALGFDARATSGEFVWLAAPPGTAGSPIPFSNAMTLNSSGELVVGWSGATGNKLIVGGVTRSAQQGLRNALAFSIDNTSGAPTWAQQNLIGHYYTGSQDAISIRVPSYSNSNTASYDILADGTHILYAAGGGGNTGSAASELVRISASGNALFNTPVGVHNATVTNVSNIGGGVTIRGTGSGPNSRVGLFLQGSDRIGAAIAAAREDSGLTWRTYLAFYTNSLTGGDTQDIQESMRLDSRKNLGVGVVPMPWTQGQALQVGSTAYGSISDNGFSAFSFGTNYYINSGVNRYIGDGYSAVYSQEAGAHKWFTAPSGTAGSEVPFNGPKMMLSQVGNFLVGTTTVSNIFGLTHTFANAGGSSTIAVQGNSGTGYIAAIGADTDIGTITSGGALLLSVANGNAARITSGRYFKVSNTGVYSVTNLLSGVEATHQFVSNSSINPAVWISNRDGSVGSLFLSLPASNAAGDYIRCFEEAGAQTVFRIRADGNVQNTNNSYGAISDAKLKNVIGAVSSTWEKTKAYEWVEYTLKSDPSATKLLGLVAQQAQAVSGGVIESTPDVDPKTKQPTGDVTLGVKYSVVSMQYHRTVQEAQHRIEALEQALHQLLQRIAALETQGA